MVAFNLQKTATVRNQQQAVHQWHGDVREPMIDKVAEEEEISRQAWPRSLDR